MGVVGGLCTKYKSEQILNSSFQRSKDAVGNGSRDIRDIKVQS